MSAIHIAWDNKLKDGEEDAIRNCLATLLPTGTLPQHQHILYRVAELAFYPKLVLVEVNDLGPDGGARPPVWLASPNDLSPNEDQPPSRQLYVLIDPEADEVKVLDMTNAPIYELNKRGYLDFNASNSPLESVKQYVAFFFSCVAGPYGVMPVVEKFDLPPGSEKELDEKTMSELREMRTRYVAPGGPSVEYDPAGYYRAFAVLLFQGTAPFKTTVEVDLEGIVQIKEYALGLTGNAEDEADGDPAADDTP
jgi:hypothetical protein